MTAAIAIGVLAVVLIAVFIGGIAGAISGTDAMTSAASPCTGQEAPGKGSRSIPPRYLALYQKAGAKYGIPWQVLAAIGKIESGHGANMGPSSAGALGPMQFMPATWAAYGVDGDGDGRRNIMDPGDAIPGAARYLKASGAPAKMRRALWHYNHSNAYVNGVLAQARKYADGNPGLAGCTPAAIPAANGPVGRARRWLGTPYSYGGGSPKGPSRGFCVGSYGVRGGVCLASRTAGFDCSSLVQNAWWPWVKLPRTADSQFHFGKRIRPGTEQPGDLVFFNMGTTGPRHVGMIVDPARKKMIEAQQTGTKIMISRYDTRRPVGMTRPSARNSRL